MYFDFYTVTHSPAGKASDAKAGLARCGVCFDVKKEDAELEEGDDGIGACIYYDTDGSSEIYDANFFGRVEATGSSGFKFLDKTENDWDTDAGYTGESSDISYSYWYEAKFVSEPLNKNSNSKKNLGI